MTIIPTDDDFPATVIPKRQILQSLPAVVLDSPVQDLGVHFDTHFKLVREDFVASVREGIHMVRTHSKERSTNIRCYGNVKLLGLNATELDGILYHFRFDLTLFRGRAVRWERRLLSGNLVVIGPERFTPGTLHFGTVVRRPRTPPANADPEGLKAQWEDPIMRGEFAVGVSTAPSREISVQEDYCDQKQMRGKNKIPSWECFWMYYLTRENTLT